MNTNQCIHTFREREYEDAENNDTLKFSSKSILVEYEEALQKSNCNVQELKARLYEMIKNESSYEEKIHLQEKDLEVKEKIIEEKNEIILSLKKSLLNMFKSDESSDYKFNESRQIELLKLEVSNVQSKNRELGLEIEKKKINENKLLSKIEKIKEKYKKHKEELKEELNEKIMLLKELEKLRTSTYERQGNLREKIVEYSNLESDRMMFKLKQIECDKDLMERDCRELSERNDKLQAQLFKLEPEYENLLKENSQIKNLLQIHVQELQEENYISRCEINLWKVAVTEIAKYKLLNFEFQNFENLMQLEEELLLKSPDYLKDKIEYVISYFKNICDGPTNSTNLSTGKIGEGKINDILEYFAKEKKLRRKIQNRYISLIGNIRVMCRIRPFLENENTAINKKKFKDITGIQNFNKVNTLTINDGNKIKNYEFDYVFNQKNSQQDVYDEVSMLVSNLMNETNICVFAFGQTSSGKTYTIEGIKADPGILIRCAKELFLLAEDNYQYQPKISVSIVEIYNEKIYNLLEEETPLLSLYETSNGNLQIPDMHPIHVNNYEEVLKLFKLAAKLRINKYNERSSRSHIIYTFELKYIVNNQIKKSKMHLVDLAGSEKVSRNEVVSDENIRKETIAINVSLNSLSNVLNSISQKNSHIPFRYSKLTHYLKESLNEKCDILLLLHISPKSSDLKETLSTLEFGTRIGNVCKQSKLKKEKTHQRTNSYAPQRNPKNLI